MSNSLLIVIHPWREIHARIRFSMALICKANSAAVWGLCEGRLLFICKKLYKLADLSQLAKIYYGAANINSRNTRKYFVTIIYCYYLYIPFILQKIRLAVLFLVSVPHAYRSKWLFEFCSSSWGHDIANGSLFAAKFSSFPKALNDFKML